MPQLQAGYILDCVNKALSKEIYKKQSKGLTNFLSYFDLYTNFDIKRINNDPLIGVANNIISRGLPTKSSEFIEQAFNITFKRTSRNIDDLDSISFDFISTNIDFDNLIFRSLHIIDPRVNSRNQFKSFLQSWEHLGSEYEDEFLFSIVPRFIGESFIQLIEPQRNFESILRFATNVQEGIEKYLTGSIDNFRTQHVDFAIELPYPINNKKGIIIEIDGQQHDQLAQRQLDNMRDDAALKANWGKTLRIRTSDYRNISTSIAPLILFSQNEYFNIIRRNFESPLFSNDNGLDALQLALTPFAIARIQKVILECTLAGKLSFSDRQWNIGVIERDVPCGFLAIEDLKKLFDHLFTLEGKGRKLPNIKLTVFNTDEFKNAKLNDGLTGIYRISQMADNRFDLLLDCSVLQRTGLKEIDYTKNANYYAVIKSSFAPISNRRFFTSQLIQYAPLFRKEATLNYRAEEITEDIENDLSDPDILKSLRYFLTSIFRKKDFRPGQRSILNRTLQLQNVVGLLPTGGGKSLTYQLSVLLQPGVSIVVDPIKSLMKDQYDGLSKANIDAAVFINSSLRTIKERELAAKKMAEAEVLFTFISPERMLIKSFREKIIEMTEKHKNYFSYCVVDEAHCVSEWGHDFRTSYLRLGRNARVFCMRKGAEKNNLTKEFMPSIPIIGLTATASFDVLSDVQRELDIDNESVLRSQGMERPELHYKVIETPLETTSIENPSNPFSVKQAIGELKQFKLVELLRNTPFELADKNTNKTSIKNFNAENFYNGIGTFTNAGLIFCPHKNWYFGVNSVADKVRNELSYLKVGTYMGSSYEDEKDMEFEENISEISQEQFINNEINILIATKAFGMGIDKPNVRFTVHFNYPSSIEGFYQEAGRAGRDRKNALCYILFCDHSWDKELLQSFYHNSFKGEIKEKSIIYESMSFS